MNSKDVHVALKRDDSKEYLMAKFGFQNEEELYDAVRKISPAGAEEMIRRIRKKKSRKVREKTISEEEIICQGKQDENGQEGDKLMEHLKKQEEDKSMKDLKKQEEELRRKVCSLEGEHKEKVSERREILEELRKAQEALKKLLEKLTEQKQNVIDIYSRYNECAEEMKILNRERNEYEGRLQSVREEILKLQRIAILVYQNGNIESEDGSSLPNFSEKEAKLRFAELINLPEAGELTINELKAIAVLQEIVKAYKSSDYTTVEVIFENNKMEEIWNIIN